MTQSISESVRPPVTACSWRSFYLGGVAAVIVACGLATAAEPTARQPGGGGEARRHGEGLERVVSERIEDGGG